MGKKDIFTVKPPSKASLPVKVPTRTQKADPYYSQVGKHYTPYDWDEIDMSKVDLGLHIDPTPRGIQAFDRAQHYYYMGNRDGGETKDLRFKVGNTLVTRDMGWWDQPSNAKQGILDALYEQTDLDTASRFERDFPPRSLSDFSTASKIPAEQAAAAADMAKLRKWLLDEGYDTIQYKNTSEGADLAAEDALLAPDWLDYERDMLEQIDDAKEDYWKDGLGDSDSGERLRELEDELEYERDRVLEEAAEGNVSYIALDPGNVRSADAKFDPKNYGKAGMMLGAGGLAVGLAGGSNKSEAAGIMKPSSLIDIPERILSPDYVPDKTQTAYKMFRTDGEELYPLFVDANTPVNVGEWQKAIVGEQAASGKVKSKIGQLAYRPGWHAGSNAAALHIGGKVDPATGQRITGSMPPNTREPNQVWAEVSMADDLDWQSVANAQGGLTKAGKPMLRDMHITDGVPYGGSYRYKTNSNMEGDWLIGGDMKVNRVLSDEEVADINAAQGYDDLPRRERSDLLPGLLEKYGKKAERGNATTPMLGTLAGLGATGAVLASQKPRESLSQGWEAIKGLGEMLYNDASDASESLHYGLTGDRITLPKADWNEDTPLGSAFAQDFGEYISGIEPIPFSDYTVGQGIEDIAGAYNEYVKPYLSDRQEEGLLGGALLASMVGALPTAKGVSYGTKAVADAPAGILDDVDPRMQMVGQSDRRPQTRDDRGMKRVTDPKGVNSLEFTEEVGDLVEVPQARASDLVNRPYVANMADTSSANRLITSVDGRDVNVRTHGGIDFPRDPRNWSDMRGWSSDSGAVTSLLNALYESAQLPGARGNPLLIPEGMKYGESSDFAHFTADLGVQHAQQNMDPAAIRALDKRIREGSGGSSSDLQPVEDWPGLMNATPEYLTSIGGKRKNVVKALDEFRNEGALNASQIRHLVNDPAQQDVWRPAQQLMVIEPNMNRAPEPSTNPTYDTDIFRTGGERSVMRLNPGWSVLDDPSARFRKDNETSQKLGKFLVSDRPQYQNYLDRGVLDYGLNKAILPGVIGVLDEKTIEEMIRRGVLLDE